MVKSDSTIHLRSTKHNIESVYQESGHQQKPYKPPFQLTSRSNGVFGTCLILLEASIFTLKKIDIDEAAVFAETTGRGEGKSHISILCRDDGIYGHSEKTNVLPAISGE